MKLWSNVFTIHGWVHDPKRRASRFRCQCCAKVIADGGDVVVERRGKSSHGYHLACFEQGGMSASAVIARDQERMTR